jgi:hypothetical protein
MWAGLKAVLLVGKMVDWKAEMMAAWTVER